MTWHRRRHLIIIVVIVVVDFTRAVVSPMSLQWRSKVMYSTSDPMSLVVTYFVHRILRFVFLTPSFICIVDIAVFTGQFRFSEPAAISASDTCT